MKRISHEIKRFALSKGADLVGIAPVSRFDGAPRGHRPGDILADAKTVIAIAARMSNTVVMGGPATAYHRAMYAADYRVDRATEVTTIFVEDQGGAAIPLFATAPVREWDEEKQRSVGDLSLKHAAEAAGLGRLGRSSLLLTREFGNRVSLAAIVTNLDLAPDPFIEEELCPPHCGLCIQACPGQAILDGKRVIQRICNAHMNEQLPRGPLIEKCRECRRVCPVGV